MISKVFLSLFLLSAAWSFPRTDGDDSQIIGSRIDGMDEISANISSIWSEINRLSELVSAHVQDGHHHQSHKGHDDHHHHHHHNHQHGNETQELNDQFDEQSNHTHEMGHPHDDKHFHHDEHMGHNHHDDEHAGHPHHNDEHKDHHHHDDKQGSYHHDDDSHEVHSSSVHKSHSHDDDNSNEVKSRGNDPNYTNKGNDHHRRHHYHDRHPPQSHGHHSKHVTNSRPDGSTYDKIRDHSDESDSDESYSQKRSEFTPKRGGIGTQKLDLNRQSANNETVTIGSCAMKPNYAVPESRVEGNVAVLQMKYGKGPLYYTLNLHGFSVGKDKRSSTHGFHIHERDLLHDGACNSAGAHFNPSMQNHGSLFSEKRHLGDLGNIIVDRDGTIVEHTLADSFNTFGNIVGKSFIVHELHDDIGKGGNPESLATGNAGRRLACCTIHASTDESIRFNG